MGLCLRAESWIWYSCVIVVAIARFVSRTLLFRGDVKRLQVDDWLMFAALCFYTTLVVTINMVADSETNLFPPGYDFRSLTPSQISSRVFGSKLVLAVEQCQCATVWAVKACLLIMYYRLTIALRENFVVKILAAYVAFAFIFMEIFYFGVWCRPFHNYWAVPTPNLQCNAATDHLITNAVFNISSDLFLLVLALQMVVRSQLPLHRKLVLSIIFGLGIFVVLASILNKYYSFTNPYGQAWTFWYTRESSTSLLVANLPYTWTLLRRLFNLRAFDLQTSQHTATPIPSPQAPAFSYHSNRTKRARTRGKIRPSLTGTTVADPPPSASLSPKSTSKPVFKTARSDSHFSPSIPALPFLPPVAELPPSNTLHFPRPEMFRADTAPPACLESGLLDFSGTSIRSKSPGNRAHAHCRSDNDLLRPWHAGDTYLYASTSSSASNSGEDDDDIEYDNGGVCALDPLSHHGRHHGRGHELCPCPPIDGLSLGLGADGWGEGDAWHGQLHLQQRHLARQHERMRRRSTRGARSRSRAESVLALKTRLGLPVELQEVPGARRGAGGETGEESGGAAANMNDGARKQSAESLDARGRSRNRSRSRQCKNRDRTAPLPLPLPPPPPHLGSSTRPAPLGTMPPAPSPDTISAPISTQLPPPPSPVLGLSRAPPLAAKAQAQTSTHIDKINVDAYDQKMPTDSSLAAASASTSSSTTARALARAHFEAAKRRAASRGCHGGAVDELLELEREILMSDDDEKEEGEEGPGGDGCGAARRKGGSATTASAESAARAPVEAAVAAKVDNLKSTSAFAQQPFTAPALVIGGAVDDRVNSQKAKQQAKATAAVNATPGSPSPSASPTAYHYTRSDVYTPSSLATTDDDVVYHDARSRVVSPEAVSDEDEAREEDLEEGEGEEVDMEALDAGETTPLTDDPPSRSLELCRAGGGNEWIGVGGGGGGSDDYAEKEREQEKKKEKGGGWAWRRKTKSTTQMKVKARKTRDKQRDVWREVVGAGVEKKKRRLRMGWGGVRERSLRV